MSIRKNSWAGLKRDIKDRLKSKYAGDKHVYPINNVTEDVDWRFCVHESDVTPERRTRYPSHILRHLNPHTRMYKLLVTRDTKDCYLSKVFHDHKREWDYIVQYRDRVFKEKKFGKKTPVFEKVRAIADDLSAHHNGPYDDFLHPADVIAQAGFCSGKSAALIAVAHTMGLEGRAVLWSGHTTAEIRIGGKWRFCENIPQFDGQPYNHLFTKSWIEIAVDPYSCPEIKSESQKKYYRNVLNYMDFFYDFSIGRYWHMLATGSYMWVRLTPYTAKALYPELGPDKFRLRCFGGRYNKKIGSGRTWIWDGMNWDGGGGWDSLECLKVKPGQGIRKSFYVSSLQSAKKITSHITMVKDNSIKLDSDNWYVRVNGGKKHYLKDLDCRWEYSGDVLFHNSPWWVIQTHLKEKTASVIRRLVDEDILPNFRTGKETTEVKKHLVGWHWHGGKRKENQLCFTLPIGEVRQNSVNTVELLAEKGGRESFNVRLAINPMSPAPKPFYIGA